jgi:hypothetical protein
MVVVGTRSGLTTTTIWHDAGTRLFNLPRTTLS